MDGAGDHAPDHAVETIIVAGAEGDRRVVRIFGNQRPLIGMAFVQPFDRELAADDGDDDAARFGFEAAIDDEEVTGENTDPGHRVALNPDDKRGGGTVDQVLVQIQRALDEIFRRRGKSGRHRGGDQGQRAGLRIWVYTKVEHIMNIMGKALRYQGANFLGDSLRFIQLGFLS
jgi:hypothetical protein